jgi:hypothetical protein
MISRTLALLSALALLSTSAPVEILGSKHVAYLSTCVPDDCPIGLCGGDDFNLIAAGYFANGPPKGSSASPTALGRLSTFEGGIHWEGTKRTVRLGSSGGGSLSTNIAANAKKLAVSEIAGDATLTTGDGGSEPFVCFRDGTTKFRATYDLDKYSCTADYYCASLDLGAQ